MENKIMDLLYTLLLIYIAIKYPIDDNITINVISALFFSEIYGFISVIRLLCQ